MAAQEAIDAALAAKIKVTAMAQTSALPRIYFRPPFGFSVTTKFCGLPPGGQCT